MALFSIWASYSIFGSSSETQTFLKLNDKSDSRSSFNVLPYIARYLFLTCCNCSFVWVVSSFMMRFSSVPRPLTALFKFLATSSGLKSFSLSDSGSGPAIGPLP